MANMTNEADSTHSIGQFMADFDVAKNLKDKDKATHALSYLLSEVLKGGAIIDWVISPEVFTSLKEDLTTHFGVSPKSMQLKTRIDHRHKRAVFFVKAMTNGLSRTQ